MLDTLKRRINMRNKVIYISPDIEDFLENSDALSQEFVIFKNGGIVDGKKAVSYLLQNIELSNKTIDQTDRSGD